MYIVIEYRDAPESTIRLLVGILLSPKTMLKVWHRPDSLGDAMRGLNLPRKSFCRTLKELTPTSPSNYLTALLQVLVANLLQPTHGILEEPNKA